MDPEVAEGLSLLGLVLLTAGAFGSLICLLRLIEQWFSKHDPPNGGNPFDEDF